MTAIEVRQIRERLRLTQDELAERLGTTQTAISYWEAGKRTPRGPAVVLLKKMAENSGEISNEEK